MVRRTGRDTDAGPGRAGDFLTAPEAHPIFGAVVARLLEEAWEALGRPDPFTVTEAGVPGIQAAAFRMYAEENTPQVAVGTIQTGFAINNLGTASNTVTLAFQ